MAQEKALGTVLLSSLKLTTHLVSTFGQASCSLEGRLMRGSLARRCGEYSALFLKDCAHTGPGLLIHFARGCRGGGGQLSLHQGLLRFNQPDGITNVFLFNKKLIRLLSLPPVAEDRGNELPGNWKPHPSDRIHSRGTGQPPHIPHCSLLGADASLYSNLGRRRLDHSPGESQFSAPDPEIGRASCRERV